MPPFFSIVTGYRNRDIVRVKRFLDSLHRQSMQDFELLFIDYGSDPAHSQEISGLCAQYTFCKYLFCDTRGRLWNRAHALNIGIRGARGLYFHASDVDMIYHPDFLQFLVSQCSEISVLYFKVFFLPENYNEYDRLILCPQHFAKSPDSAVGLICVPMTLIKTHHGYDEHYVIWGFEDNDMLFRLREAGLASMCIDNPARPIYHQWHRPMHMHPFMQWFWFDMAMYHANVLNHRVSIVKDRGRCISTQSRPLNNVNNTLEYQCNMKVNLFACRDHIIQILALLYGNPGTCVHVVLSKHNAKTLSQKVTNFMNACMQFFGSNVRITLKNITIPYSGMLYFFYRLIIHSRILSDYRIKETANAYHFYLLTGKQDNAQ